MYQVYFFSLLSLCEIICEKTMWAEFLFKVQNCLISNFSVNVIFVSRIEPRLDLLPNLVDFVKNNILIIFALSRYSHRDWGELLLDPLNVDKNLNCEALTVFLLDSLSCTKTFELSLNHYCHLGSKCFCLFHWVSCHYKSRIPTLISDGLPKFSAREGINTCRRFVQEYCWSLPHHCNGSRKFPLISSR